MPELVRDSFKEDMIFEKLERWIWSLEHDKPPTMQGIEPSLALKSLARIYGPSKPGLPTVELPKSQEKILSEIILTQKKMEKHKTELKQLEKEAEAYSVRIAELMKDHEHGILETTTDKYLIDFVSKKSNRADTAALKEKYPAIYTEVLKTTVSRKLNVSRVSL